MHGKDAPETSQRGSHPIDEIFVSTGINVKRGGFLEHAHLPTDHRAVWIEINQDDILGANAAEIPKAQGRRLKCKDPRTVKKYNKILDTYLSRNDFYTRIHSLMVNYTSPLSAEQIIEYEKLDNLRHNGMKIAERKCRKIKRGNHSWSIPYQEARDKLRYIKLTMARKKGNKISARMVVRLAKKVGFNASKWTIDRLDVELKKAQNEYL